MQLLYDPRDEPYHRKLGSRILDWLDDLGAVPLNEADPKAAGFLFAGARPIEDYRTLVADYPLVRDRPEDREPLLRLDAVLASLGESGISAPMPRTWVLQLDGPFPEDLRFPLFVRTAESSWKKGGQISRVRNAKELEEECFELRRALGWNAPILARQWLDLAPAGEGRYGPVAQEVRTWIVDGEAAAWTFHHMHIVLKPVGFPPNAQDMATLKDYAATVGSAFSSRLVAADFGRDVNGRWWFIEAGPGSCAGTGHEAVFKAVARRLVGVNNGIEDDALGGAL